MKKTANVLLVVIPALLLAAFSFSPDSPPGFANGTPEIKSINALAFSPEGVLFIGDSKSASIFAVETKDLEKGGNAAVELKNIDKKIAEVLGTDVSKINIIDIAVNPVSKKIYCAVLSGDGTPVILRLADGVFEQVSLKEVSFASVAINNPISEESKDQRGNSRRSLAISDLVFSDGKVMVSGLSNQEFGSTFRIIPFPFTGKQDQASLEIYHAAHGKYETSSPINTFTTAEINGKKYIVASYTCTPLVLFPMDEIQTGKHVKGRTVGEFGAGNRPLDMILMTKGADSYLVMCNSDRPVMKVSFKDIAAYQGSLTEKIKVTFSTAGVPFISFPVTNVTQLDRLDESHYIFVQRRSNGDLDLRMGSNEWF